MPLFTCDKCDRTSAEQLAFVFLENGVLCVGCWGWFERHMAETARAAEGGA